ncbi:hypothetical protein E4U54_004572 [Claviceps lovelessii]|nr:hypothetical protein E4U54_004572 [Claviceps lovelessii]
MSGLVSSAHVRSAQFSVQHRLGLKLTCTWDVGSQHRRATSFCRLHSDSPPGFFRACFPPLVQRVDDHNHGFHERAFESRHSLTGLDGPEPQTSARPWSVSPLKAGLCVEKAAVLHLCCRRHSSKFPLRAIAFSVITAAF